MDCIICRQNKDDMTDEHVIPDSLGGYYHIHNVCKSCNSLLGGRVDSKLVNHYFSQWMRFLNNLKGKSSSVPNPFRCMHHIKGNPEKKVQLRIDKSGKSKLFLMPEVSYQMNAQGVIEQFEVSVDNSQRNKIQGVVDKISQKLGKSSFVVDVENLSSNIIHEPMVSGSAVVDFKEFRIGLLKIAYEFAVDSLPAYYVTESAVSISNALLSGKLDGLSDEVFIGTGFDSNVKNIFDFILDFSSKKHYLVLITIKGKGLVCFVYLYGTFSIGIALSEDENILRQDWVLGV